MRLLDHPRRRLWAFGLVAVVLLAGIVAATLWWRSDERRARADLRQFDAVTAVALAETHVPTQQLLVVNIDASADSAAIEEILEATYSVLDDERAHAAEVVQGSAALDVHPLARFRPDPADAAVLLSLFSPREGGRAVLDDRSVTLTDSSLSPVEGALEVLETLDGVDVSLEKVTVQAGEGRNAVSITDPEPGHRDVLEALAPWESEIRSAVLGPGSWLTLRTTRDLDELEPLAAALREDERIPDPLQVSLAADDGSTVRVGAEDPAGAFALLGTLEEAGWSVQDLHADLTSLDVSRATGRDARPAQLADLAEALRSAGVPEDAGVEVDSGALFLGSLSEMEDAAPALDAAHSEGYLVRWTREDRGEERAPAHVIVEMPEGHSLSDEEELVAAMRTARSVPREGGARVTIQGAPADDAPADQEAVTLEILADGSLVTTELVLVDESEDQRIRDAWDASAR